ncbi:type II toxin-antitoxin system VapC family toxin [Mucilaginibacter arboris]|uniref:PIN domain-containing protein n=1 Tax=Mucilaginibacter arboris TaxID=2682090 RepID=A0A7K1SXB2_9SPHI|nr:type II toxin-antitoxin system VapC family toxin [Mucilaginibacter arboris]MVN21952.1 PIN domain-containing protein [Mucilaginibacter arboris]
MRKDEVKCEVFLDTSSLVKLYHREDDTAIVETIFKEFAVKTVFLSELTKIEFTSTIWKKVRVQQIGELTAKEIIVNFESDISKFTFIPIHTAIVEQARNLINRYGINGLRTLDSLQLSTAIYLKNQANLFVTSDKLLNSFFVNESLPTYNPLF